MLLGLPSQMGIKLDLDSTIYMCFDTKLAKYRLHYSPLLKTSDLQNSYFHLGHEMISEYDKSLKTAHDIKFAEYYFDKDKIFIAYVSKPILNTLYIGVYEYQSKLLREKWHNTTQQNNYKKLNIG